MILLNSLNAGGMAGILRSGRDTPTLLSNLFEFFPLTDSRNAKASARAWLPPSHLAKVSIPNPYNS